MAAPLKQLLAERHLSARGLSLSCGLAGDTVRNLLSGRAHSPRGEVAQALADKLGVTVNQLYGREPLPEPTTDVDRSVLKGDQIKEIAYRWNRADPPEVEDLDIEVIATWVMPSGFLGGQGHDAADVVVVRAPQDGPGFRRGDRLLIDRSYHTGTPDGVHLLWDGRGLRVAECHLAPHGKGTILRVERQPGVFDEFGIGEEIEVIGRAIARWHWM